MSVIGCYSCYSGLPGGFDPTGGAKPRDGHGAEAAELAGRVFALEHNGNGDSVL